MNKGLLIVIDGIDGSGKSTQVELLAQYLTDKNIPFEVINFPRYGENIYADLVTRYLEREFGAISKLNPYLVALAYAGDRSLAKPLIENWLNEGKLVLANRYVSSSKAHLGANLSEDQQEQFMEWLNELEYETNGIPKPKLSILLKVDPKVGQKNALDKEKPDMHEKSFEHEEKAGKIFLELSQVEENWKIIECMENGKMKTKEQIHKLIVEILK